MAEIDEDDSLVDGLENNELMKLLMIHFEDAIQVGKLGTDVPQTSAGMAYNFMEDLKLSKKIGMASPRR